MFFDELTNYKNQLDGIAFENSLKNFKLLFSSFKFNE